MDLLDNYKDNNILNFFPKPSAYLLQLDTIQRKRESTAHKREN